MAKHHVYKLVRETKTKVINTFASLILVSTSLGAALPAFISSSAEAASTVVVNSTSGSWSTADTRPGGNVGLVGDNTAPYGVGALQLTTDSTNSAKAQLITATSTRLADISSLSYQTKQIAASSPSGDPSYQLAVDLDNNGTFDTNLVYEPYWNGTPAANVWQSWDVLSGKFWSSQTVGGLTAGAGGAPFYTISQIVADHPEATVQAFGTNVGTYNPSYIVEVDGLNFDGTTYDFEPAPPAAPTNLTFVQGTKTLACDGTAGTNSNASGTLHWAVPAGGISQYVVSPNYPDNSGEHPFYPGGGTNSSAWVTGNFAHHGEGVYTYTIKAQGTNGLWGPNATCSVIYDTHSPTASFTGTVPQYVNGNFTVTGIANDNAKLKDVFFDVRDSNGWVAGCVSGTFDQNYTNDQKDAAPTCTINTSNLVDGQTYTLRIHASDFAGYGGGESRQITVDRTIPIIEINNTAVTGNPYFKIGQSINVHVIDNDLEDTVVNATSRSSDNFWDYHDGAYFGLGWLRDGDYSVTSTDKAGNSTTVTFRVDHTRPVVSSTSYTGGTLSGSTLYNPTSFTINANDDASNNPNGDTQSGLASVVGNIYDATTNTLVSGGSNSSTASPLTIDLSGLSDGQYYVKYNAHDIAGNTSNTGQFNFTVDHTAPNAPNNLKMKVTSSGTNIPNNSAINKADVTASWDSNNIEPVTYIYHSWYDNGSPYDQAHPWVNPTSATSLAGTFNQGEGLAHFCVIAVDIAGNQSACSTTFNVTYDITPPDAPTLISPSDNAVVNGASITQSWSDTSSDVDHYVYESFNDANATSLRWRENFNSTSKTATNVADGSVYWWHVIAVDKAGNVSGTSPLWKITVDNTSPDVQILSYGDNGTNVFQPTISVDGSTTPTGYTYSWTTDPNVTISHTDVLNPTFTVNQDGTYDFTLTVTDLAGNSSTALLHFSYTTPTQSGGQNPGFTQVNGTQQPAGGTGTPVTTALADSGTGTDTPEVKGDSTTKSNVKGDNVVKFENSNSKKGSNFLGLGWWWLLILAAFLGFIWFLAGRRSDNDKA